MGNWRDSNQGTGYGPIPFDVNTALVSASLHATARLARAGIISDEFSLSMTNVSSSLSQIVASSENLTAPNGSLSSTTDHVAAIWEVNTLPLFEVVVNGSVADNRLKNLVAAATLSDTLLVANGTD